MAKIAIIGASLSGSALALALRQPGAEIFLFDKGAFPRRKACGEGLSALGCEALYQLGLGSVFEPLPKALFRSYTISTGKSSLEIPALDFFSRTARPSVGIEREVLDNALLTEALNTPDIQCRLGTTVRSVEPHGERFIVRSAGDSISADAVILACGGGARLLEKKSASARAGATWKAEGVFRPVPDSVHIRLEAAHELFFSCVGPGRLNMSVLADSPAALRAVSGLQLLRLAETLCGFKGEISSSGLSSGFIASFRRSPVQQGMLLIGDACEVFDPIGGMGMTHALLSAQLARDAILRWLRGTQSRGAAFSSYARDREKEARLLRKLTQKVFFVLKRLPEPLRHTALRVHRATAISGSAQAAFDIAGRRSESSHPLADR